MAALTSGALSDIESVSLVVNDTVLGSTSEEEGTRSKSSKVNASSISSGNMVTSFWDNYATTFTRLLA
jgi:hypothetical protein